LQKHLLFVFVCRVIEIMTRLEQLENRSIHILREAYSEFKKICMLWSIGKDSTVLLWLTRKAFFGHVPIPLIHIDTSYKIPEMITFRDSLARTWKLDMIYGRNKATLDSGLTFPEGKVTRLECCRLLKTEALKHTIDGTWLRYRLNHQTGKYEEDVNRGPYDGVILGIRADEEGSRSKERYFSARNASNIWELGDQPPEFWNQYKTDFAPGTHVRIHPLLDWCERDIWEYIGRENIPVVPSYFNHGSGKRYRSLGCLHCTAPV
jgi:sulfate adenylyltransferase subunit 2